MTTNLYALIDRRPESPRLGLPFYVGIGTDKRPAEHLRLARYPKGHRNPRLHAVLVAHFALDLLPEVRILAVCPNKAYADLVERRAIAAYGREGIDPGGILCNLACGGQGPDVALMQLPEIRARNAAGQHRRSAESRGRSSAALIAIHSDPVLSARKSAASREPQKNSWANPVVRAARTSGMKGKKKTASPEALAARRINAVKANSTEANAKKAEASRLRWADPEFRERMSAKKKAAWTNPEQRAAMLAGRSDGIAKSWEDPAVKARRIAGIRAAAAAKTVEDDEH